jgi:oxaloacetate decarboxylase alpha subunit
MKPKALKIPTLIGAAFGGGFYAGRFFDDGVAYALIVAPKTDGEKMTERQRGVDLFLRKSFRDMTPEEIGIVREEMGYPVMATPYSQLVGIQALLNLVNGERYTVFPDENLMYLAGHMGPIPGTVDPEVMDRAFAGKRGQEFLTWTRPDPSLKEIRAQLGENLSDEELILRFVIPGPDVDAMLAAGAPKTDLTYSDSPEVTLVRDLMNSTTAKYMSYDHDGLAVTMKRG